MSSSASELAHELVDWRAFVGLEKEKIYRKKYDTIKEVKKDVFWYIEVFYNRKRRHSTLEYMTPVEYLRKYDKKRIA